MTCSRPRGLARGTCAASRNDGRESQKGGPARRTTQKADQRTSGCSRPSRLECCSRSRATPPTFPVCSPLSSTSRVLAPFRQVADVLGSPRGSQRLDASAQPFQRFFVHFLDANR